MSRESPIIGTRPIRVRRAPRRLAEALSVISLSIILITVVAIAQSYHVPRVWQRCSGNRQWAVASCRGELRLLYFRVYDDVTVDPAEMMKSGWRLRYSYDVPRDSTTAMVRGRRQAATITSHIMMGINEISFIGRRGFGRVWYDAPLTPLPSEPGFYSPAFRLRGLATPYWPFAAVGLLGAALSGRRLLVLRRARLRLLSGRCPRCGYDLRASNARCPECGSATVESNTAEGGCATEITAGAAVPLLLESTPP